MKLLFFPIEISEIAFKLPENLSTRNLTGEHRHLSLYPSQLPPWESFGP